MDAPFDIFLASASPRRRELLEQLGVRQRLLVAEVDESPHPNEAPELYVVRLALAKARAGRLLLADDEPHPVLGADTAVVVDGHIIGKPRDEADFAATLRRLSARTHQVMSGVALVGDGREESRLSVSTVRFRKLSEAELAAYWRSGEPADKAGGYAIQGLGAQFIERLEGSYSGVMGLPLFETAELLQHFGIPLLREG